ncbi:hypothetical protein FTO70_05110 [Methanosarcina sp. KYL-1]|uniref:hypothetical protein n=1 Tax=Methanosarcina sp. KYL-1 TaxID=2602068 RepID=UPI002100D2C8|nr:hypothetical protein [Methanosarcina sp. KYL-1]MCQ1535076.1 hypothetical protein [Methanosarcina sp. KYL-1]
MKAKAPKQHWIGGTASGCLLFIILIMLIGMTALPAAAEVSKWDIIPENPEAGEAFKVRGTAAPGEEVEISISFEKTVPVYVGEYSYELNDVEILNFESLFTVRAEEVENLKVKMKNVLWITESAWASGGTASVSHTGAPPGEYHVLIDGKAKKGVSGVKLKIISLQKLKAGPDGAFSYTYNTESVPAENFEVEIKGSEKKIILSPDGSETVQQVQTLPEENEGISISSVQSISEQRENIAQNENSEITSKEFTPESESSWMGEFAINLLYLFAGSLTGAVFLLTTSRKKRNDGEE